MFSRKGRSWTGLVLLPIVFVSMIAFIGSVHAIDTPEISNVFYFTNNSTYGFYWMLVTGESYYVFEESNTSGFDISEVLYSGEVRNIHLLSKDNETYHYRVKACSNTECSLWSEVISIPYSAPSIANVSVSPSSDGAVISWETDGFAISQVEYGISADYGNLTEKVPENTLNYGFILDDGLDTSHSAILSNLSSNTTYHFRVISENVEGGRGGFGGFQFIHFCRRR